MSRTELSKLGEFGLIKHLSANFAPRLSSTIKGIGDDAAVTKISEEEAMVLSTDMLLEWIHFDLAYTPLKHLGYKAVVVNLSDVYAMNARPTHITVSIALSNRFSLEAVDELYAGIRAACDVYGVDLVGGDTCASPKGLILSITAWGKAKPADIVYRSGAKAGDLLCATGDFGGAYVGLQLLEREKQVYMANPDMQPELEDKAYIVGRILKPEARKDVFEFFASSKLRPTAMIDVSDGLSSDLRHLCEASGVGALLEEAAVAINQETYHKALDFNIDPIVCALHGGEDYELLFTLDPKDAEKIRYQLDIKIVGEIVPAEDGVKMQSKGGRLHELPAQGFRHI